MVLAVDAFICGIGMPIVDWEVIANCNIRNGQRRVAEECVEKIRW